MLSASDVHTANLSREHTTSFNVVPSTDVLVIAELGVSGSMRPVRMFFSRGILPTSMQLGFVRHGSIGFVYFCTKVLRKLMLVKYVPLSSADQWGRCSCNRTRGRENLQHRIPDKKDQHPQGYECKSSDIDHASPCENVAFHLFFLIGIRVVKIIVFLYILWEK